MRWAAGRDAMDGRMLRVLFVIDSAAVGGAEYVVELMMRSLPPDRFACYVVCPAHGPMVERFRGVASGFDAVPERRLCHPLAILRIARLIRRWRIDVVHTCLWTSDLAGILAARLAGAPRVISHVVGQNFFVTEEQGMRRWRKRLMSRGYRVVYRWADCVIAVSEAVKRDLVTRPGLKVPPEKIVVIPHGLIQDDLAVRPEHLEPARRLAGVTQDARLVVAIGGLIPLKGHRYLLEALGQVVGALPHIRCVLIGDGPQQGSLAAQADRLGLNGRVVFAGPVADELKHALVNVSCMVVLPSLSEGFSVTLLEAMALGKPIVATDVGGNREVIEDGVTGLLVPPADPDALAAAICRFARDEPAAASMGEAGRRRLHERFVLREMINRLQGVYLSRS